MPIPSPIPPQRRRDFLRRALALASLGTVAPGPWALGQADLDAAASFLKHYIDGYLPLYKASSEAAWAASTDVSEAHTADQIVKGQALNEFVGSRRGHSRPLADQSAINAP
jgi:peptidyl-dipeptidase A